MSKETIEWLNTNTMLGFTANREKYAGQGWVMFNETTGQNEAWWHRDDFQNGYEGAIPADEIVKVLFNWEPIETEIMHKRRDGVDVSNADAQDGNGYFMWVPSEKYKGIMHPTTEHEFGVFGIESYRLHSYKTWMLDNVAKIVDHSEVGFASAGLLRNGGVAYVQAELPEGVEVAGMEIRPSLLCATSVDGTKSTQYKITTGISICDNSLELNLAGDQGKGVKIKHSSRSMNRVGNVRDALEILFRNTEQITQFLDSLSDVEVSDAQFQVMVDAIKPMPEPVVGVNKKGEQDVTNKRAITIAENVHQEMHELWTTDYRAAPWRGTMLGALQAVNTWHNHYRGANENGVERVMTSTLAGDVAKFDTEFFDIVKGMADQDQIKIPAGLFG